MSRAGKLCAWLLLPLSLLTLLAGASTPPPPPAPDPAWATLGLLDGPPSLARDTATVTQPIPAWTRVAFQRFVNEQWDIYATDAAGVIRPVVQGGGDDRFPSFDRGARRLAYSSLREGGTAALFVSGADGRDERALVTDQLATAFPDWSPNGREIVYQGFINGQYELFIVDVDSGARRRLTANAAFDGEPRWSPDGRTILFTSDREDGVFYLHTVSAAGGPARRLNSLPYSLHPAWSPDGEQVGFDADTDSDGWQELAIMNADGTRERTIYDPGPQATAWAGTWSPDGRYLSFTEVQVEFRNGSWTWVSGRLRQWDSVTRSVSDLLPGRQEWYPAWQTADDIPPTSSLAPLPPYSRASEPLALAWSGSDRGGAGLRSFDLLASQDGQPWQTVSRDTIATDRLVRGRPGETVRYLTRARDNAWNLEPLRETWARQTTFYNTSVSGLLTDNRGRPLQGVTLQADPALLFPTRTDEDGRYQGYTAVDAPGALFATAARFLPLPATLLPAENDFARDLYLLPEDTILRNGQFEEGEGLPGWARRGDLPAQARYNAASGRYAARLGGAAGDGTAVLAQTVTIPADMPAPTLALLARAAGEPGAAGGLDVRLIGGGEERAAAVPLSAEWALFWLDMAEWRGETVEVALIMSQQPGAPALTVWLDDVSLGAAGSDLWLGLNATPPRTLPGDQVTLRLPYGNRGGVAGGATAVTLVVPEGLGLRAAYPPGQPEGLDALRWELEDLPPGAAGEITAVLDVTGEAAFTAPLRATISGTAFEAWRGNNSAALQLTRGAVTFLPLAVVN